MVNINSTETFSKLMKPILEISYSNPYTRKCGEIEDTEWLKIGIMRVLGSEVSGRGFLQSLFFQTEEMISVGLFFEALKSGRRLKYLRQSLKNLIHHMSEENKDDSFSVFKELDLFQIYAGDGHYHASATHDEIIGGSKRSTQHFYGINMRTRALSHYILAEIGGERKKEHDTRAFKRLSVSELRQEAIVGEKALHVYDRALLDFPQWEKWKQNGIYFLSRNKKDFKYKVVETLNFDKEDSVNNGILKDEMVETDSGKIIRKVSYVDPLKNKYFSFVTNLSKTVRPGTIAYLYKCRWDLEKVFDDVKNKMFEKKSWGNHDNTKTAQATFICLSYNLLLLLESHLHDQGVSNKKDFIRKKDRIEKDIRNSNFSESKISSCLKIFRRATQRPLAFFRWMRSFMILPAKWGRVVELLRQSYLKLT